MTLVEFGDQGTGASQGIHHHSNWRQGAQAAEVVMVDDGQYFTFRNPCRGLVRMVVVRQDHPSAVLSGEVTAQDETF